IREMKIPQRRIVRIRNSEFGIWNERDRVPHSEFLIPNSEAPGGITMLHLMRSIALILTAASLVVAGACHKKPAPVARPMPPPATTPGVTRRPTPPEPVNEPTTVPPDPARD